MKNWPDFEHKKREWVLRRIYLHVNTYSMPHIFIVSDVEGIINLVNKFKENIQSRIKIEKDQKQNKIIEPTWQRDNVRQHSQRSTINIHGV